MTRCAVQRSNKTLQCLSGSSAGPLAPCFLCSMNKKCLPRRGDRRGRQLPPAPQHDNATASHIAMLIYRKGDGIKYFLRLTGSALPKAMLPGLLSAFETFCLGLLPGDYLDKLLVHPYPSNRSPTSRRSRWSFARTSPCSASTRPTRGLLRCRPGGGTQSWKPSHSTSCLGASLSRRPPALPSGGAFRR